MIEVEFNEGEQIAALFARLRAHLSDLSPVMQDIGEQQVAATRGRFLAGQAPDGSVWAPKSPATLAAQAARGDRADPRPLFGPSRRLSTEIFYRVAPGGASVTIGSSLIYAAVQQYGAAQGQFGARMGRTRPSEKRPQSQDYFFPIPWGDIPARPFLGLSDQGRSDIVAILTEWLESAMNEGGAQA